MEQCDHYKEFYRPTVIDSKLLSRDGAEIFFSMRWLKKALWVTATMDADYKAWYFSRNEKSWYGFVDSTRIQEVVNVCQPSERELPAGTRNGFIWRQFSISRFEERDRGVYVELEAMALSRPVPACLASLVNPLVRQISQSSVATSLSQSARRSAHTLSASCSIPGSHIEEERMGLSWQQGPLSPGAIGRFLVPEPLPNRLLYAEPLRRRMRVRFGGNWIADTEDVMLLFEPGHYPMAYFKETDITPGVLEVSGYRTKHPDLGPTSWYSVRAGDKSAARGAWKHTGLPAYARELEGRVAFAWPVMDGFFEEEERIMGHAADSYHRIDIRQSSRNLVVRYRDRIVADTKRPLALYESGFAPRWYVPRTDIDEAALTPVEHQTFCPYKGLCSYYNINDAPLAAWSYREAYSEVGRINNLISFEPDIVSVQLDGVQLQLEPGQTVIPHGPDRDLDGPAGTSKQS